MDAYLYIPSDEQDEVLSCGIKLSAKKEKDISISGHETPCISALLHPKDNMKKFNSVNFICIRIDIKSENCYIADKSVDGKESLRELYLKSIIPARDYVLGTYRHPECLIPRTILPESLSMANKAIGFPLLYENSEELYVNNLIAKLKDSVNSFDEILLKLFFDKLIDEGTFISSTNHGNKVYIDGNGKYYTIKSHKTHSLFMPEI